MDNRRDQGAVRHAGTLRAVDAPALDDRGSGLDEFTRDEARRLVFARWLYRRGLLTEWPDLIRPPRRFERLAAPAASRAPEEPTHDG